MARLCLHVNLLIIALTVLFALTRLLAFVGQLGFLTLGNDIDFSGLLFYRVCNLGVLGENDQYLTSSSIPNQ